MIDYKPACCFTGHRMVPNKDVFVLEELLLLEILRQYKEKDIKNFISGGAKGFDLIAGFVTLKAKKYYKDIKLHMFLPCYNQQKGWPLDEKVRYERLISLSDTTHYLSREYKEGCMHKRNRAMVKSSKSCIAYYKDIPSGTRYTVEYAKKNNLTVVNMVDQINSSIII